MATHLLAERIWAAHSGDHARQSSESAVAATISMCLPKAPGSVLTLPDRHQVGPCCGVQVEQEPQEAAC